MKSMKRILSGILAAVMVAASATFVSAAEVTFTDRFHEDGTLHWAWQRGYVPYLVEKNVLNGYKQDDGTFMFKPEDKVTRAEFIKMLDETFGLTETAKISTKYSDVAESDWFYPYFAKAVEQGYILSYGEKANPNGELSREEATALLVRYLGLSAEEKVASTTFADYDKINANYRDYVLMAAKAEVINGYAENDGTYTFRPQNTLTRAEALTVLYRAAGAIFTDNTSGADEAAYEKNAVIKNGGITLSNQDLDGRVIVGEGADKGTVAFYRSKVNDTLYIRGGANIVFDAATVNTVVVDSKDIINITIQAGTSIEHLIINEQTNVTVGTGTTVNKLTVAEGAQHTTVSGAGAVKTAVINAADFSASMVPETYEIAKGLTATFASKSYKGSSTTAQAFTATPYVSVESNYHCVNMTAVANGTVRYYFTNTADVPDFDAFEILYKAAKYGNVWDVRANKAETKVTYSYSQIKDFAYVVLQMTATDGTAYQPIVISNEVAEGTGFTTDPYLKSSTKIEFTTKAAGTVYYMYATSGNAMNATGFVSAYEAQTSALKGEITDRTAEVTINSRYSDVNGYMVFMYKSESGLCYTPVVVALGDTGFYFEPELDANGLITSTPGVDGILYYYYSETATLPAADKFNTAWRNAIYSDYEYATTGREVVFAVSNDLPSKYQYIIMCMRDAENNYLTPIVLKLEAENGFAVLPKITDNGEILFKTTESGIVYYYYAMDSKVPTPAAFDENYTAADTDYRGLLTVDSNFATVTFDAKKAATYPYLVFMLEVPNGTVYQPVVLSLSGVSGNGFSIEPHYINSNTIEFKTNYDCEVWWFYSRVSNPVSTEDFAGKWYLAQHGDSMVAKAGTTGTVLVDIDLVDSFPYLVFATSEDFRGDVFTTPVMLQLKKDTTTETVDDTGFRITNATRFELTLTSFAEGNIYYYETNSSTVPTKTEFDTEYMNNRAFGGYVSVANGEKNVKISVSGAKKYVVLQMDNTDENGNRIYYNVVQVNVSTGSTTSGTGTGTGTGTPGADVSKYGFEVKTVDVRNHKLIILPEYTGKLSVVVSDEDKFFDIENKTYDVVKGQVIEIPYPEKTPSAASFKFYIYLQLTAGSGYEFTAYPAIPMITMD